MSLKKESSVYPAWLYFFPFYVMLFSFALLGRIGYIIVADTLDPNHPLSPNEFFLYYLLTYLLYFPAIIISQWIYYRILSRKFDFYWKDFNSYDKILIIAYDILGFLLFLWVEHIFGVNAPYITTWDFEIGWMYVWFGDFLFFFIVSPLFMTGFHGINFAICHSKRDSRQYQFYLVVVGTSVLGTISQDWWWWISAPMTYWGPGITIYFYWTDWIQVPFIELYIPVVYLIVAIISLTILFLATIKQYPLKDYIKWCLAPYLLFILIGNLLFYI